MQFLGATVVVAAAMACLIFEVVIKPKKQGTNVAYLVGYGLIIPFWAIVPMYAIQTFQITNKVFRFIMGTVPSLAMFRTLEGE
jgi:hypothetical protein